MQWFWDDIRVESRTATAADCEQGKVGKKALRLEQTAAGAWVKGQGWDCIADYLEGDNLLQVPVQVGGVTMTWTACWRLWGERISSDLSPCVEREEVGPSRYECVEKCFVQDGECPQSLWVCDDPLGPLCDTFGWTTCGGLRGNGVPCPHSVLSGVWGGISR